MAVAVLAAMALTLWRPAEMRVAAIEPALMDPTVFPTRNWATTARLRFNHP